MFWLHVYPGIHLFIGWCCDFFFPAVMNRISLEAYPLLAFISSFPPSFSISLFFLFFFPPKAKLKYCIFKAPVLLSCSSSLSVQMMWKRLKVILFLANPRHYVTMTVLNVALLCVRGAGPMLLTFHWFVFFFVFFFISSPITVKNYLATQVLFYFWQKDDSVTH